MVKHQLVIATRQSPLALCQAELIKTALQAKHPHLSIALLGITTAADETLNVSLKDIGGKGLFVKELELALLQHRADIAVHSMKDVPMSIPQGLALPVITKREEARDVLVSNQYLSLDALPSKAIVGTSSLRRQTQMRALRADLDLRDIRGNVNTRLARLDQGDFDALILAAAGLKRLHLDKRIRHYLSIEQSLPAAGQGALGIECRIDDEATLALIAPLNHAKTAAAVLAERALCRRLGGGCHAPIAAYADSQQAILTLRGLVADPNNVHLLRATLSGEIKAAENIGNRVAETLLQLGAAAILQAFKQ